MQTPGGKDFKLKEYLTVRDRIAIQKVFLSTADFDPLTQSMGAIKSACMIDAQNKLIELAVTEYDGSAEKVLDRLLDNPDQAEYDFILKAINDQFPAEKKAVPPTNGAAISE